MPLDTCITNVGEYYSSHYLDSTFAKDVKDLVAKWNERGSEAPPRRLQNLSQYYFRAKTQVLDEEEPIRRQFAGDEARGWHSQLLHALGYTDLQHFDHPVEGGDTFVPTLGRVNRYNQPWLVVCETHFSLPDASLKEGMPSEDPLGMEPYKDQLKEQADHKLCEGDWSRCVGRIFTEEDAPRWILLLAGSQLLLLDRNTFAQGRFLSFDLDDAFGRKEKDTFNHIAAFLSAESLCPDGESDEVLLDKLEEQSHKFAHGVTESLQFAVREAIELLVNEWARDRTEREKRPLLKITREELKTNGNPLRINLPELDDRTFEITAEHLRREALTFVYRLLFCFYAEARGGELEILPVDDNIYRLGYSLESLRDLELVPLTEATGSGTYFHQHLKHLFQIIHNGFHPNDQSGKESQSRLLFNGESVRAFEVRPLTATLFSPEATPLLNRAELSNRCLQQVIRYLSLSKDDKYKTIGRVNYAELGINQLGAVYEGLLSYKGMFADQELIHVKPASKSFDDKKTPTWFVPRERIDEFKKDEVERLPDGKPRIYRKGEFILHLNGIDREQSASYYTPEVLTKCLVEEALRELLKDYTPDDADKILELKICEPAMGSGAFLNEAAEQLATRYLELKQKQLQEKYPDGQVPLSDLRILHTAAESQEVSTDNVEQDAVAVAGVVPALVSGSSSSATMVVAEKQLEWESGSVPTTIEPARFGDELRRVKHYIATNNIYGVDLNETAVELGQLSLWLGSIHRLLVKEGENGGRDIYQSGATPWFGLRLRCGNSLIGARRAVWTSEQLKRGEHAWDSKLIQQVQSDIEALREHTNPETIAEYRKDALDLACKVKWDELAEDADECRAQVVRFCECARERSTAGLAPEEKKLYEKRQTTWKWVSNQKDQDTLLSMFDLLPDGRVRTIERISFDIFSSLPPSPLGGEGRGEGAVNEFKPGLPRLLKPGESRSDEEIYHFLVFDPEMVPTRSDKLIKSFWKDDCDAAGDWVKKQVSPKWKKDEITEALAVCDLVDQHWQMYAIQRAAALDATACTATVWPIPANSREATKPGPTLAEQERVCHELESTSGSFQRLRLVMDTWCSLWFWPLDRVGDLPSRDAFLASARLLLSGDAPNKPWTEMLTARLGFEIDVLLQAAPESEVPDTELLAGAVAWFGTAETICSKQNFHHWELVFAEVLGEESIGGGFHLILGNPPWMRVDWQLAPLVCELEPRLGVQGARSAEITSATMAILTEAENRLSYCREFTSQAGSASHLSSLKLYPELSGVRTNYYKCFIVRTWGLMTSEGIGGLLHPEGVYEDPKGGSLRQEYFPRLIAHYQFKNEKNLFADVHHVMTFSINLFRARPGVVLFATMVNLFHPSTISTSRSHTETAQPVPGIKTDDNEWETRGHKNRIVTIDRDALRLFAAVFDEDALNELQARPPQVHSKEILKVLKVFSEAEDLGSSRIWHFSSTMINESTGQRDGIITSQNNPSFEPKLASEWIVSGPHFYVASPFQRNPRVRCTNRNAYDSIDLTQIGKHFLPRAVYRPGNKTGDTSHFENALPIWKAIARPKRLTEYFRLLNRLMCDSANERTLICAIAPRGCAVIHSALVTAFESNQALLAFAGGCFSLPFDFVIKSAGRGHVYGNDLDRLPFIQNRFQDGIINRALRLVAVSDGFEELWISEANRSQEESGWITSDQRLVHEYELHWRELNPGEWTWKTPLRSDFARREALLELDVLVSLALGMTLNELLTIYRVQFPVMRMYELADEYDARGRHIPNTVRRSQGGTQFRTARETAAEHFPDAYKTRPADAAFSSDWPFADETSIPVDQAHRVPDIPEFDSIHRFVAATRNPEIDPNAGQDGPPSEAFTAERIAELQSQYGPDRVPLMLDVSWDIDDGLQSVTKTFYPPFTKVDREADYALAWECFSDRFQSGYREG